MFRLILLLLSFLAALLGVLLLKYSKGAIHDVEGFLLWLIAAVLLAGAAVADAVVTARKRIVRELQAVGAALRHSQSRPHDEAAARLAAMGP
jgi:hypothetical protein